MSYAVNTDKSVLKIGTRYYCCDDAIWFVGISPKGPWEVCTEVRKEVQSIPPQCPVYNIKCAYVYEATPTVVCCGYTPGYIHSYVYHGCVVYGTGWHYRPRYGRYYYPRPITWGFGVHCNPWTGWGFSFGMSNGWLHIAFGYWRSPYYGWWGPAGYWHRYYYRYHTPWRPLPPRPPRPPKPPRPELYGNNIYRKRPAGVVDTMDRKRPGRPTLLPGDERPANSNNIYVGPDGSIHRKTREGCEQRRDGQRQCPGQLPTRPEQQPTRPGQLPTRPSQQPVRPGQLPTRPSQQPQQPSQLPGSVQRPSTVYPQPGINLNREAQLRNRGLQRSREFQRQQV